MKKKITLIVLQAVFGIAVVGFVWWLAHIISTPSEFKDHLANRTATVVERIKDIRKAEQQFKSKYNHFTADFDSLITFVLTAQMEGERKLIDENDSVAMAEATAKAKKMRKKFVNVEKFTYSVKDSLFKHLTPQQVEELRYIPFTNNKTEFILEADKLTTEAKVTISVVECRAPYKAFLDTTAYRQEIINLIDDVQNNQNKYPGIKFGALDRGTNEAGNWE